MVALSRNLQVASRFARENGVEHACVHPVEDAGVEMPFIEVLNGPLDWSIHCTSRTY
jgi:hypothetical protein